MAEKKTKPGAKAAPKKAAPKAAIKKTSVKKEAAPQKAPVKAAVKKEAVAKVAAKKTPAKKVAAVKKAAVKKEAAPKKAAPKKEAQKAVVAQDLKSAAQCIFDLYNIKFGMLKSAIEELFAIGAEGFLQEEQLLHTKAQWIQLYFDHLDRLWQVKASYLMGSPEEAEALLETMSQNYKMQTPSTRIAFELGDPDAGNNLAELQIRYSEANLKRMYFHHMMAVGAAKREAEEERERIIKEKEEEEYIPSGPLIF